MLEVIHTLWLPWSSPLVESQTGAKEEVNSKWSACLERRITPMFVGIKETDLGRHLVAAA